MRLTPMERELLRLLSSHPNEVVTHSQIVAAVWPEGDHADAQSVRVLVGQLRKKIEADPKNPQLILTEPRQGYRFVAGAAVDPKTE